MKGYKLNRPQRFRNESGVTFNIPGGQACT